MNSASEAVGSLETAIAHTQRLLQANPAQAAEQAREILKAVPRQPIATLLLGIAQRASGDLGGSSDTLKALCLLQPNWAAAHYELGRTLGLSGKGDAAIASLRRALQIEPRSADAWRMLADHLTAVEDVSGADAAYAQSIRYSTKNPQLLEAAAALCENRLAIAEPILREHLRNYPTDVAAIRMLGEVAARLGRYGDAEKLLARCVELAPGFSAARHNYASVLHRMNKPEEALSELDTVLANDPNNPGCRNLKAAVLARVGEYDRSVQLYAEVLAEYPYHAKIWMSYGHVLKTAGQTQDCISAYRRCIGLAPQIGEAYWSLANLKTFRFTPDDLAAMRAQLARTDLSDEDRFHFDFAMGKALEDAQEYESSFAHYAAGNQRRREHIRYDADELSDHVRRSKQLLTREFFAIRSDVGCTAPDPIFVLGLPRAGSTLIEQILSSHPSVEGTMELPDVLGIARELGERKLRNDASKYPEALAMPDTDEFRALGERYLQQTRIQRKSDAPFFIDKMPNNFAHVGLIHLMLPNAKIIDARRHPLGCCFSGFKQHFARGQQFSYSLEDLGRYYRDYVELMAHFDAALPGRVHRVIYEEMVADTEAQVRSLLEYCGLPFDERCLRFYENDRAVRTASSEQVRRPIFRDGVDQWRHYEPWLDPLKRVLGPVLDQYPAVPDFPSEAAL
jgi:predicted Zn-dependent protease